MPISPSEVSNDDPMGPKDVPVLPSIGPFKLLLLDLEEEATCPLKARLLSSIPTQTWAEQSAAIEGQLEGMTDIVGGEEGISVGRGVEEMVGLCEGALLCNAERIVVGNNENRFLSLCCCESD
jgi:hypothetical protein